jgi:hypothetical protein
VRQGDEEAYFVTRSNVDEGMHEGVYSGWVDPKSPGGLWQSDIAVGKLRLNGLVSLDAKYSSAENAATLKTKPFKFAGQRLFVNIDASGGGSLVVEARHAGKDGEEGPALLTSAPLVYNGVALEVLWSVGGNTSWGGNATLVAALAGVPIVLTMRLQDCHIYGFQFKADDDEIALSELLHRQEQLYHLSVCTKRPVLHRCNAQRGARPKSNFTPLRFIGVNQNGATTPLKSDDNDLSVELPLKHDEPARSVSHTTESWRRTSSKCAGVPSSCSEFEVFWWIWGINSTNVTAPWTMQPLTKTQLGGHCSALTPSHRRPFRKYRNLSEWSEGAWPRLPQNNTQAQLAVHLAALEAQLPHCVPDPNFSGNAVFDFEGWDPVWEMNNCTYLGKAIYPAAFEPGSCAVKPGGVPGSGWRGKVQQDSIALVRAKHPDWREAQLVAQAKQEFQSAAALFMVQTMQTVKRIRPKATWGWYMFPYKQHGPCHWDPTDGTMKCGYDDPTWGKTVTALYLADWLQPAWQAVGGIFPSIYLSKDVQPELSGAFVMGNVHLSVKIANAVEKAGGARPKVVPFGTLYYHGEFGPDGLTPHRRHTMTDGEFQAGLGSKAGCLDSLKKIKLPVGQEIAGLMNKSDVALQMAASLVAGADGIVLWGGGSQPYLHTPECKTELLHWLDTDLGPAVCDVRRKACEQKAAQSASQEKLPLVPSDDSYVELHVDATRTATALAAAAADGSLEKPFASVFDAQRALREGLGAGRERRVLLHGRSQLPRPLALDARDSGSADAPIRWLSGPGEPTAQLTGGIKVPASAFSAVAVPSGARGVVKAQLFRLGFDAASMGSMANSYWASWPYPTDLAELFLDGQPMTLARSPSLSQNGTWLYYGYDHLGGAQPVAGPNPYHKHGEFAQFTLNDTKANRVLKKAIDGGELWLHGYWQFDWSDSFVKIDSIVPTIGGAMRYTRSNTTPPQYPFTDGARFYAVNNLALLDAPGEYYIDRAKGQLYFLPPTPLTPTSDLMISHLESVVTSTNTSHISFESMIISGARGDVMSVASASNFRILNSTISNGFGDCLTISGTNLSVAGSTIVGCGASGISVASGDIETLVGGNAVVANNVISNFSRIVRVAPGAQAVKLSGVGVQLSNNTMAYAPHTAIYGSGNDHLIEKNQVSDVCYECNDCGAFYAARSWAQRGNTVRYNNFERVRSTERLAQMGMNHGSPQAACYLDDQMSGYEVYGNTFADCETAVVVGGGRDNQIHDNHFENNDFDILFSDRGLTVSKTVTLVQTGGLADLHCTWV